MKTVRCPWCDGKVKETSIAVHARTCPAAPPMSKRSKEEE